VKQVATIVVNPTVPNANVSIDCNGDGDLADATDLPAADYAGAFDTYDIQLKANDTVNFSLVDGTYNGLRLNPQILLGSGANVVNLSFSGDTLQANSRVLIDIAGGAANDTITVTTPNVLTNSAFSLKVDAGSGNDVVVVSEGVVTLSSITLDVALGLGTNTMTVNHLGIINTSNVAETIEGGNGPDTVNNNWFAYVNATSRVYVTADLGAGNDKFTAGLDLGVFDIYNTSEVHFDVSGGGGANQLQVTRGATIPGGVAGFFVYNNSLLDIRLKGGAQTDTMTVDLGAGGIDPASNGTLRVRADVGGGNDTLNLLVDCSTNFGGENPFYDVVLTGGNGNDKVNWTLNNGACPGAAANFAPAGRVLLDGAAGSDTCVIAGTGLANRRGCEY
jgi:hypothetical protein